MNTESDNRVYIDILYSNIILGCQFAVFYSRNIIPLVDNNIVLTNIVPNKFIKSINGNLTLSRNKKYFIKTQIENVTFLNHIGLLDLQWFYEKSEAVEPLGDQISVRGIGDLNPQYGFESSDIIFTTSKSSTLLLNILNLSNVKSIGKISVTVNII
uniref:Uncharacterized protein n=1 Tax=viral metagenome TaxID=1070528 RepID=A0A6C0JPZ5_9ZZZZ